MRGRSVCLVAGDGADLTTARRFAEAGWQIRVLTGGEDSARPPDVPGSRGPSPLDRCDRVRQSLERLHQEQRFSLIIFAGQGGLGLRAVQAKRSGLAFDDVCLAARLDDCGAWRRERERRWPSCPDELEVDFAERYSFENADARLCPSPDVLGHVRRAGWAVDADALIAPDEAAACETLVREQGAKRLPAADDRPLVTVGIAHYNLGRYLPEALASLAAQTYPNLEVLVIDDGSTDAASVEVFGQMESRYPRFRFLRQANAGIGATRNRALREARGTYFLPMDADNIARPDMVERFVTAMERNPEVSAMTCYFLAFQETEQHLRGEYIYAERPAGGPHALASIRNVYGDANALFRTADFRQIGGYETDRDTSCEDWEAFVKLVHAGRRVDVIPEHLFFYRHRDAGFSRATNPYPNHQRVLRQFFRLEQLPPSERVVIWTALLGFERRREELADRQRCVRYRVADRLHALGARVPFATRGLKRLLLSGVRAWGFVAGKLRAPQRTNHREHREHREKAKERKSHLAQGL